MKGLKLKKQVLKFIYVMAVAAVFLTVLLVAGVIKSGLVIKDNYKYVLNPILDSTVAVVDTKNKEIIKPYIGENVTIDKYFYSKDDDEATQKKSLIYYQNTYMQNSGLLYVSSNTFDVVAVLDGKVSNIKEDNILGNVVEVTHGNNLLTVYYCLGEINVTVGSNISQDDLIGIGGTNNLNTKYKNSLLFEVYLNGHLIDPESFFEMDIKDLQID